MATWERMHSGFSLSKRLNGNSVTELWVARDIEQPYTSAQFLIDDCPPIIGQTYNDPNLPGAVCYDKTLVMPARRRVASKTGVSMAMVAVKYSSNPTRFGFRWKVRTINWQSVGRPLYVPVVVTGPTGVGWQFKYNTPMGTRAEITRTVVRRLANIDPDLVAITCTQNIDSLYHWPLQAPGELPLPSVTGDAPVGTIPFIFKNFEIRDALNGTFEVRYHFVTSAPVLPIAAAEVGAAVDLPELSYLEEYAVDLTANSQLNENPVRAVRPSRHKRPGAGLP